MNLSTEDNIQSHRKWRESKQQPSRARSGHQISCCLVSYATIMSGCPANCSRGPTSNKYRSPHVLRTMKRMGTWGERGTTYTPSSPNGRDDVVIASCAKRVAAIDPSFPFRFRLFSLSQRLSRIDPVSCKR